MHEVLKTDKIQKTPRVNLFSIETNNLFPWQPVPVTQTLKRVAQSFYLSEIKYAFRLLKRNKSSELYKVGNGFCTLMLRCIATDGIGVLERQCRQISSISYPNTIKPILTIQGTYTVCNDNYGWMAYEEQKGEIFSGRNADTLHVLSMVVELENALERLGRSAYLKELELSRSRNVMQESEYFLRFLTDGSLWESFPKEYLSFETAQLIEKKKTFLIKTLVLADQRSVGGDIALTHNDLQHANVLISSNGPIFLDIEDICFNDKSTALAHATFKLIRHGVYTHAITLRDAQESILPNAIKLLAKNSKILSSNDFLHYALVRMVSDISTIIREFVVHNKTDFLYDFEKKIHNIFEVFKLLGGRHGSVA